MDKRRAVVFTYTDKITGRKHIAVGFYDGILKKVVSVFHA